MTLASSLLALALVSSQVDRVHAWREDAGFFARELERLHPAPFAYVSREQFEAALSAFEDGVAGWSDERATAEFLRLVALVSRDGGDGHTAAWPTKAEYLPLQLHGFSDGWFVVAASTGHEGLVGARVLRIGDASIDDACTRIAPLLSKDNEWNLRARLALALTVPALLRSVGIADTDATALEVALPDGNTKHVSLPSEPRPDTRPWGGRFARSLPAAGSARWLQERESAFRAEVLAPERALYVQYNAVLPRDESGLTLVDFANELARTFEERGLARIVVDVRSNGGGDSSTFGPLVETLGRLARDRADALFVLAGRATFSAGGNFVATVCRETNAVLVGEPPGGAPDHFGDAEELTLPHHADLFVRISTRAHRYAGPGSDGRVLAPDVPVTLSSQDYFAGRDPVLERALAQRSR